jgi:hypothetical protein
MCQGELTTMSNISLTYKAVLPILPPRKSNVLLNMETKQ